MAIFVSGARPTGAHDLPVHYGDHGAVIWQRAERLEGGPAFGIIVYDRARHLALETLGDVNRLVEEVFEQRPLVFPDMPDLVIHGRIIPTGPPKRPCGIRSARSAK